MWLTHRRVHRYSNGGNAWKIEKRKVHVILRDNANNANSVIKVMDRLGVASLGCFAHTLQLIVNEVLLSQHCVSDALATDTKTAGHFKHSPLAYSRLEDIQLELNMLPKHLQQDVRTRWNSTYYMDREPHCTETGPVCIYSGVRPASHMTSNQ